MLLCFFGDPKSRSEKQDAIACVMMAVEIRERLKQEGFSMEVDLKRVDKSRVIESLLRTIRKNQGH